MLFRDLPPFNVFLELVKFAISENSAPASSFLKFQIQRVLTLDEEEWISETPNFFRNLDEDSCDRLGKLPSLKNISDITPSLFELHSVLCLCPTFDFSSLFLELFEEGMKLEALGEWEWDWPVVVPWIALFVHQNIQEVRGRDIGDGGVDGEAHVCLTSKIVSILNDEAQRAINNADARALMSM